MEKRYLWKLKRREIVLGERTFIMGVLNVTPDSFSDGGLYADPDRAFARAVQLEEEGADIVDIGAESTRPGSARIPEAEELRRLIPVLKRLRGRLAVPISVDTYKSGVAEKALEHGAEIINDPTGLLLDPLLTRAVNKYDAGLIINHMRGTPETWSKLPPLQNLMRSIGIDLEAAIHRARQGGVDRQHIVIDPGIGFGKRKEQNAEIIARLGELGGLDLPILVGPSRKSFLKRDEEDATEFATAAAVAASVLAGAHIIRVHNVIAMKNVVAVADSIRQYRSEEEQEPRKPHAAEAPASAPAKRAGIGDKSGYRAER
jgi:dihydropteroate synthase